MLSNEASTQFFHLIVRESADFRLKISNLFNVILYIKSSDIWASFNLRYIFISNSYAPKNIV